MPAETAFAPVFAHAGISSVFVGFPFSSLILSSHFLNRDCRLVSEVLTLPYIFDASGIKHQPGDENDLKFLPQMYICDARYMYITTYLFRPSFVTYCTLIHMVVPTRLE